MKDFDCSQTNFAYSPAFPGHNLKAGCRGSDVNIMQSYLNAIISFKYPRMVKLSVDGIFGDMTKEAVLQYQAAAGLETDGIIGKNTWSSIVSAYNSLPDADKDAYPGAPLKVGASGAAVANMQAKLGALNAVYGAINYPAEDGKFGDSTKEAVSRFQRQFSLTADGVIDKATWDRIILVYTRLMDNECMRVSPEYPGHVLSKGSRGESVRLAQSYLNGINARCVGKCPQIKVDGIFGKDTEEAVKRFQRDRGLEVDVKVGKKTWEKLINSFNNAILD